jgi:hypothetical protein
LLRPCLTPPAEAVRSPHENINNTPVTRQKPLGAVVSREPATTHIATDRTAFHILHPFTMVRYLPTVSSYRLLVLLKPPTEGYNVILC